MLLCVRVNECVYMYVLQKVGVGWRGGVCDAVSVAGRRPAWGPVWPSSEAVGWSTERPRFDSAWAGLSLQRPLLRLGGGGGGVPILRFWPLLLSAGVGGWGYLC